MAVKRVKKEDAPKITRSTFKLIGDVLLAKEGSFLVQKAGAFNRFWLDIDNATKDIEEGYRYCFNITISTYIGRDGESIRTKLRTFDWYEYDHDTDDEDAPAFIGDKEGEIIECIKTDVDSLWVIVFKNNTNEIFYLRYFAEKAPSLGKCTVNMDLRSTALSIHKDGTTCELWRDYIDKEGNKREVKAWYPALELKGIE